MNIQVSEEPDFAHHFSMLARTLGPRMVHPLKGAIFETFVVSELRKRFVHHGERPPLYFFRDSAGREVDVIVDFGTRRLPVEIKLGETIQPEMLAPLNFYAGLSGHAGGVLIHGGASAYQRGPHQIRPWWAAA